MKSVIGPIRNGALPGAHNAYNGCVLALGVGASFPN